jgi:hypothetical protein
MPRKGKGTLLQSPDGLKSGGVYEDPEITLRADYVVPLGGNPILLEEKRRMASGFGTYSIGSQTPIHKF